MVHLVAGQLGCLFGGSILPRDSRLDSDPGKSWLLEAVDILSFQDFPHSPRPVTRCVIVLEYECFLKGPSTEWEQHFFQNDQEAVLVEVSLKYRKIRFFSV